jgi:hypothetical protein
MMDVPLDVPFHESIDSKNEWNYGIFMDVPLTCWIVLESL